LDVFEELPLTTGGSFDRYWSGRETLLRHELGKVEILSNVVYQGRAHPLSK